MAYVITSLRDEKLRNALKYVPWMRFTATMSVLHRSEHLHRLRCLRTGLPGGAIYQEDMVPEEEQEYIEINANFFK